MHDLRRLVHGHPDASKVPRAHSRGTVIDQGQSHRKQRMHSTLPPDPCHALTVYILRSTFPLVFEWDPDKAASNATKHGIDFCEIVHVWRDPCALFLAVENESEARYLLLGALDDRIVTVVFTVRKQAIRSISARYASREERRRYAQTPRDG
jgi:uncharacterized DUF497 family protein